MPLRALMWLCAVSLSATAAARPFDEVLDSGRLTVFVYEDYAPYSFRDGDTLRGIDVEIGRAFGRELGLEVEFLVRGADENVDDDLRVNVWKGDLIHRRAADVMMHVPYDRELDIRNELAVLMAPYYQERMAVVYDTAVIERLDTFGRFTSTPIGVELDTAGDFFLSNAFGGQLREQVQRARTFDRAVAAYSDGEVPAVLASRAQAEWIAHHVETRRSRIATPPMPGIVRSDWPIGIAIRHDSRDLGYALTDVIDGLIASGEMADIAAGYGVYWRPPTIE